jgi:hypothetical protein
MAGWHRFLSVCWFGGLVACGGNAESNGSSGGTASSSGGAAAGGSVGPKGGAPSGGASQGGATSKGGASGGGASGGSVPWVDPNCPTVDPPPPIVECDPFGSFSRCPSGSACYPYVQHPFGEGCDTETYGALCLPAGSGTQGALCGDGQSDCAAGYICVIGAHAGARCAKLCAFAGGNECPLGMICGDTDIEGYGVCD